MRLAKDERGQSLVEFALTASLLVLLAVGVVDAGRAIYYTIAVNNGATAGAEYAASSSNASGDTTDITNTVLCDANGGTPPNCNSGILTSSNITITSGCACDTNNTGVSCNPMPASGSCASISCSTTQTVQCVQVQTTAQYSPLISLPGLPNTYTANGKATMRVRQQ